jgi:hypothetical protein
LSIIVVKGKKNVQIIVLSFVTICNQRFYPVDISAKTSQLHLLALARLNRQWISVDPFIGRHVSGIMRICKDIEDSRRVNDREEGYG